MTFHVLVIFIIPTISYAQFCANAVVPPTTINSINITDTSTGSVSKFPFGTATFCGQFTEPINPIWLGENGAFTYTINFSLPIDSLDFTLSRTGGLIQPGFEVFTFSTNSGTPSIIDKGSCETSIINNVITSGKLNTVGGGNFTLVNTKPFTSLTVSGPGGVDGSLFAICSSSISTRVDVIEEICAGDSVLIQGVYRKFGGLYSDTIFGGGLNGVDSIIDTYLIVDTLSLDLGIDTLICFGDTLTLDASTANATYLWQDNSSNPTFNVIQQGKYWSEITVNNCTASDTILVDVNSFSIDLGADTTICVGDTIELDASITNATYLWQDNSTDSNFKVIEPGNYRVEVNVNNCAVSDSIFIGKSSIPIDLGDDTFLCLGDTLTLNASTLNAAYLWQDNSTNPTYIVSQQGIYSVEITLNNCSFSDTIIIDERDCEILLEIPNVFTPNNDGFNDLLVPIMSKGIVSMHIIIINRWGNKVFETNNPLVGWDGQNISDGVYFWTIDYTDLNGEKGVLSGRVTLLR